MEQLDQWMHWYTDLPLADRLAVAAIALTLVSMVVGVVVWAVGVARSRSNARTAAGREIALRELDVLRRLEDVVRGPKVEIGPPVYLELAKLPPDELPFWRFPATQPADGTDRDRMIAWLDGHNVPPDRSLARRANAQLRNELQEAIRRRAALLRDGKSDGERPR